MLDMTRKFSAGRAPRRLVAAGLVGAGAVLIPLAAASHHASAASPPAGSLTPKILASAQPDSSACNYRHKEDGLDLAQSSSLASSDVLAAESTAVSGAIADLKSYGQLLDGTTFRVFPGVLTQPAAEVNLQLGTRLDAHPVYVVNVNGLHVMMSGKFSSNKSSASPAVYSTSAEIYYDSLTGVELFTLYC